MDAGASNSSVAVSWGAVGEKERAKAPTSDCAANAAVRLKLRGRMGGLREGICALCGDATRELGRLKACDVLELGLVRACVTYCTDDERGVASLSWDMLRSCDV